MIASLTAERVRGDIDVLSRAGLGMDDFLRESITALARVVPWLAACAGTNDPATLLLTSGRKYGSLESHNEHDALWGALEYGMGEWSSFRSLAAASLPAVAMRQLPDKAADRSPRMNRLMRPVFGFRDEARLLMRDDIGVWGFIALFRGSGEAPFDDDAVEFLGSLSAAFARGVRAGILHRFGDDAEPEESFSGGPAVVIVDRDDNVAQISRGASHQLGLLGTAPHHADPLGLVNSVAFAARRAASDPGSVLPRARVRTRAGRWLVLHGAPMDGRDGASGDVVVTIEEARPPEIVSLVVAAFGLTQRERDVTRLVLQGVDTKEIGAVLHVSPYTVQDHLKSIFDKAGVRSRRELIARVYFDQYVPRMGGDVGTDGWFA